MKHTLWVLLAGSTLLSGCAPYYRRAAMCPPNPCGPCGSRYYLASQPCDSGEVVISSGSGSAVIAGPGSSSPGLEGRVNSIENDLNSLKNDVGTIQRQGNQIDRKLDKVIDNLVPLK